MMVMSFPLLVRAARVAFEEVNPRLEQIARTLGARDARVFVTITLPLAARGIVSGMLLAFARAIGEFGATILVAGNIPGRTTTLSLAIYNLVQLGRDGEAFRLLGIAVRHRVRRGLDHRGLSAEARVSVVAARRRAAARADFTLEVSLELSARTTALYGPSGAGKTSLLEVIAGTAHAARRDASNCMDATSPSSRRASAASATCRRTTRSFRT